jgi:hypothetical protein
VQLACFSIFEGEILGNRTRQKKAKKRLHKRRGTHYKCAHECGTPLYFIRRAGCICPGELAAKPGDWR